MAPLSSGAPPHAWPKQRRYPRYRTDLPLRVSDNQERHLDGRCIGIAEGGLGGVLPEPIPVGCVVRLWLAVPTHPALLAVWAVVRYQVGLQHGFEFVSLEEGERVSIRQFCNELAMQLASG